MAHCSLAARRDTIELPVTDALDLGGWDLRKALGLLAKSNAPALEWLSSPIVYRHDEAVAAALAIVAGEVAHLPALAYHYDRLARGAWAAGEGPVRLKSLFYALRPALALAWMRRHGTPPPMDIDALMAGLPLASELVDAVEGLRICKAAGMEADMVRRCPEVEVFLVEVLAIPAPRPAVWDRTRAVTAADALLLELVAGEIGQALGQA